MTTRKKNSTCGWCGQPTAVNRPHTKEDCEMAKELEEFLAEAYFDIVTGNKYLNEKDLQAAREELKALQTKADKYDALEAAIQEANESIPPFHAYGNNEAAVGMANTISNLYRLVGDE